MDLLKEFISVYGSAILSVIMTAIAGYLGILLKRLYQKNILDSDDGTKEKIVNTCVKAVEQMYKDLHGAEKLQKALEAVSEILVAKNITITDTELRMLIESAVGEFNDVFNTKEYEITEDVLKECIIEVLEEKDSNEK